MLSADLLLLSAVGIPSKEGDTGDGICKQLELDYYLLQIIIPKLMRRGYEKEK